MQPTQIGIYLPDDVGGTVAVHVDVYRTDGCKLGEGDSGDLAVTPGKATGPYPIIVTDTKATCPHVGVTSDGDAGAEAATDADAHAAADAAAEACDDATTEVPVGPTCAEFCAQATTYCSDIYPSATDCVTTCQDAGWPPGTGTPTEGNTIACRLTYAKPATAAVTCPFTAPASPTCR